MEVDEPDTASARLDGRLRKQKIVLAIHRKKQGETTSHLYENESIS